MGKRLLSILGLLIAIVGIVFGGNLVLVIIGCVILYWMCDSWFRADDQG